MEDAMILNKASFERGFAHGMVFKCEVCSTNIRSQTILPLSFNASFVNF